MPSQIPVPSISSLGDAMGAAAERHLDLAFRAMLAAGHAEGDDRFVRFITRAPHPMGNFAIVSDPSSPEDADAAAAPLCDLDVPAAVLLPGAASADVDALLQSKGFGPHGVMPAMAVDIAEMGPADLPSGYEFVQVGAGERSDEWAEVFTTGYELPEAVGRAFSPNAMGATDSPDAEMQCFLVTKDGRGVATSALYLQEGLAGIYCVATIPEERGKGLGAYATAEPSRRAKALGYGVGVLQSSEAGYGVYKKLGFGDYGGIPMYVRMPG